MMTLMPSSRARIPIRSSRPSITSDAEAGLSWPYRAFIHSSFVRRSAPCSASIRRAALVFPVPGSPTVKKSVGSFIRAPLLGRGSERAGLEFIIRDRGPADPLPAILQRVERT